MGLTALGVLVGHLSSSLVLLPFFVDHDDRLRGVRGERVAQWLLLSVVTVVVFGVDSTTSLLFTLVPILVWSAMRNSVRQAQLQLVLLTTIGTVLTSYGYGPLASSPGELLRSGHRSNRSARPGLRWTCQNARATRSCGGKPWPPRRSRR